MQGRSYVGPQLCRALLYSYGRAPYSPAPSEMVIGPLSACAPVFGQRSGVGSTCLQPSFRAAEAANCTCKYGVRHLDLSPTDILVMAY